MPRTPPVKVPTCLACGRPHYYHGIEGSTTQACGGHKSTTGEACKQAPVPGLRTCRYHGSGSPQARAKSARIQAERLTQKVLAAYARPEGDADPAMVLIDLITWGNAKVNFYRAQVLRLRTSAFTWGRTRDKEGGDDRGTTYEAGVNTWVSLLSEAEQVLARQCVDALKVGLKQRELDIAARMADMMLPILDAVLKEFGHDPNAPEVAEKVERILHSV